MDTNGLSLSYNVGIEFVNGLNYFGEPVYGEIKNYNNMHPVYDVMSKFIGISYYITESYDLTKNTNLRVTDWNAIVHNIKVIDTEDNKVRLMF
ncbi:MAG: hypothetical protein LBT37_06450 [Lactobacillaceae bacterium]|jgi:hypothetical protein|nr:hypothetical protein [Lactobacillaceae bacterium]